MPLDEDNFSDLQIGDDNILYLRSGPFYYGRSSNMKPTVMSYAIKEREAKSVIDDVTEWSATADGKHVLAFGHPFFEPLEQVGFAGADFLDGLA